MTEGDNETIADILLEVRAVNPRNEYADRIEAAMRRTATVHTDNGAVVAELVRRLRVAEDALAKLVFIFTQTEYAYGRDLAEKALATIREVGRRSRDVLP